MEVNEREDECEPSPLTRLQEDGKTLGMAARTRIEKINIAVERRTQIRVLHGSVPNYHIN